MCDSLVLFNTAARHILQPPFTTTATCQQWQKQPDTWRHWLHTCTHRILKVCYCETTLLCGHTWPGNVCIVFPCDGWMSLNQCPAAHLSCVYPLSCSFLFMPPGRVTSLTYFETALINVLATEQAVNTSWMYYHLIELICWECYPNSCLFRHLADSKQR